MTSQAQSGQKKEQMSQGEPASQGEIPLLLKQKVLSSYVCSKGREEHLIPPVFYLSDGNR